MCICLYPLSVVTRVGYNSLFGIARAYASTEGQWSGWSTLIMVSVLKPIER